MNDYIIVKTTAGRIKKGILSVPVSLIDSFPKERGLISILLDNSPKVYHMHYSPYESSTRECRINGLERWFGKHNAQGEENIVITIIDKDKFIYRLCFEDDYLNRVNLLSQRFIKSSNETTAENNLTNLSKWTGKDKKLIVINQLQIIVEKPAEEWRSLIITAPSIRRERTPVCLKVLLGEVYDRKCQICQYTFQKRDNKYYYEIHHLDPIKGNNPKNLIVVCANCHCQFEYAEVTKYFNIEDWLIFVKMNNLMTPVKQVLSKNSEIVKSI
ncbi:HNH endonuclease [bacterium]|nr:HNH endonuclease [bacterium]